MATDSTAIFAANLAPSLPVDWFAENAPPSSPSDISDKVVSRARALGVDEHLARAIAKNESAFNPKAVSPVGAQGVMQLMPAAQKDFGVTDPFDADQSIEAGVKFLKQLQDAYPGDWGKVAQAYHQGPGAVAAGRSPGPATRDYMGKVVKDRDVFANAGNWFAQNAPEGAAAPDATAPQGNGWFAANAPDVTTKSPSDDFNTKLTPAEEQEFQQWKAKNAPNDSGEDYDLRGFFKSGQGTDERGHATDKFKKPNHPTFSTESQYSGLNGNTGGQWIERDGKTFYLPSETNLKHHSTDALREYFQEQEPDVTLVEQAGPQPNGQPVAPPPEAPDKLTAIQNPDGTTSYMKPGVTPTTQSGTVRQAVPSGGNPLAVQVGAPPILGEEPPSTAPRGLINPQLTRPASQMLPNPADQETHLPFVRMIPGSEVLSGTLADKAYKEFADIVFGGLNLPTPKPGDSKVDSAVNGVLKFATSLSTPETIAEMLVGAGLVKYLPELAKLPQVVEALKDSPKLAKGFDMATRSAVSTGFGLVGAKGALEGGKQTVEQIQAGNVPGAIEAGTQAALSAFLAGFAARHAASTAKETAGTYPTERPNVPAGAFEREPGGLPGKVEPEAAAQKAESLEAEGRPLAAAEWRKIAENNPVDLGGGRRLEFMPPPEGSTRRYYRVTDKDGKVLRAGTQDTVQSWLDQQGFTKTSSEAGGGVSVGNGTVEPADLKTREHVGTTRGVTETAPEVTKATEPVTETAPPETETAPEPVPARPGETKLEVGATFETPEGTYKVGKLAGGTVYYHLTTPDGKRSSRVARQERFEAMVGIPQVQPENSPIKEEPKAEEIANKVSREPEAEKGEATAEKPAEEPSVHKYSSTQVQIPEPVAEKMRAFSAAIPDEHLGEEGREPEAHITALYGLTSSDVEPVRQLLADQPPITVTLGKTSLFKNDDADVLKVDVDSPELHALNAKLATLPNENSHPKYIPHATLAYLGPGKGAEYDGKEVPGVTGQQVTLSSLRFSGKDGTVVDIPLTGKPTTTQVGGTPQIKAGPGTKYVLPSFITEPHSKPAPEATAEGPIPSGHWMNEGDIEAAVERHKDHPVLARATKFLEDFKEQTNTNSDGWAYWKLPIHAAGQLMGMIQHPEYASEANFQKALAPIKAFYTRTGTKAGMKFPEIAPAPQVTQPHKPLTEKERKIAELQARIAANNAKLARPKEAETKAPQAETKAPVGETKAAASRADEIRERFKVEPSDSTYWPEVRSKFKSWGDLVGQYATYVSGPHAQQISIKDFALWKAETAEPKPAKSLEDLRINGGGPTFGESKAATPRTREEALAAAKAKQKTLAADARKRFLDRQAEGPIRPSRRAGSVPQAPKLDAQDLEDLAQMGAEWILDGQIAYGRWSVRAGKELGELGALSKFSPHLKAIHERAQEIAGERMEEFAAPESPAESESNADMRKTLDKLAERDKATETSSVPIEAEKPAEAKGVIKVGDRVLVNLHDGKGDARGTVAGVSAFVAGKDKTNYLVRFEDGHEHEVRASDVAKSIEQPTKVAPEAKSEQTKEGETSDGKQAEQPVRGSDSDALETELPGGSKAPGRSGRAPSSRRGSRGTGRQGRGASAGEGSDVQPGAGAIDAGVGNATDLELDRLPPRAPNPDSARHAHDFRIPDGREVGGNPAANARANIAAIRVLRDLQRENRPATVEEQDILGRYVGWGFVPQLFAASTPEFQGLQDELRSLISEEEYKEASRSTTNAHYTADPIVDAMWSALQHLGATSGMSWLEPAVGVGTFFGRQPEALLEGVRRIGLDKDALSAQIAAALYPDSGITHVALEESELPDDYFDGAVSNVPFGSFGVHDNAFRGHDYLTKPIHNYFFAKSLGLVRPGGIVAFITSRYTMDGFGQEHARLRSWISDRADFLGAVRLPSGAFKKNAGTDVITDVIFLRRRLPGEEAGGEAWGGTQDLNLSGTHGSAKIPTNEYYHRNPQNVLGTQSLQRGQFSDKDYNVAGNVTGAQIAAAMKRALPENQFKPWKRTGTKAARVAIREINAPDVADKIGALFFDKDGNLFRKTTKGSAVPLDYGEAVKGRIKGQLNLKNVYNLLLEAERTDKAPETLDALRKTLNQSYDHYVKIFGPVSARNNLAVMKGDPDAPLLPTLERRYDSRTGTADKAPIFERRMLQATTRAEKAANAKDALYISLNETGRLDWPRMTELTGKSETDLQQELKGLVYLDPATRVWQMAEEYLSGSVRTKLKLAERIAKLEPRFAENVTALQSAQPDPVPASKISAMLGATWVPLDVYSDFVTHVTGADNPVSVRYAGGEWQVDDRDYPATRFDTAKVKIRQLLETSFNQRRIKVTYRDADRVERVDKEETLAARSRQRELQAYFEKWLMLDDGARSAEMTTLYNDLNNDLRGRVYDGAHLTLPDMSHDPGVVRGGNLDPHQLAAVWRIISQPNVLLAHWVGTGKTFDMIAGGMELQRLGLIKRPMYVVPNATLPGWQLQFSQLYPQKRVIVFSDSDLEKKNRLKTIAMIATGEWDAVVVPSSSFKLIPVSEATFQAHYDKLARQLREQIKLASEAGMDTRLIKRMETAMENLLTRLKDNRNAENQDNLVTWEQLAIDQLFVDESHHYKKLGFSTKQPQTMGIDQNGNQTTFDMLMKLRHTQKYGRGAVFASGTPVTNTMGELYNLMQYLIPEELAARGLGRFDEWAAAFGRTIDVFEPKIEGGGYRLSQRFAEFVNLPELSVLFRAFADVVTNDMVKIPRPPLAGGARIPAATQLSDAQQQYLEEDLRPRGARVRKDPRRALPDNMLAIYTDAAKMALDIRMVMPHIGDDAANRMNRAADIIYQDWKDSEKVRGAQAVFLDFGKPFGYQDKKHRGEFSPYDELIKQLILRGIPKDEIAHVYTAGNNKLKRANLFRDVNEGKIRVVIGSTAKLGEGVNIQERLYSMHHLDLPHTPAELDQREGRGLRQGNINDDVRVYYYMTQGSLDESKFKNVVRKAKFIEAFLQNKSDVRKSEDVGGMIPSLEQFAAATSGDPRVMRKFEVDSEIDRLGAIRWAWRDQQHQAHVLITQDAPRRISDDRAKIRRNGELISKRNGTPANWTLDGKPVDVSKEGETWKLSEAFHAAIKHQGSSKKGGTTELGSVHGIPLSTDGNWLYFNDSGSSYVYVADAAPRGVITKINNYLNGAEERNAQAEKDIAATQREVEGVKKTLEQTWPYQAEFDKLVDEQDELQRALLGTGDDAAVAGVDGEEINDASVEAADAEDGSEEEEDGEGPAIAKSVTRGVGPKVKAEGEGPIRASRRDTAPIFYSQLQRAIESKMPTRAMPSQVEAIVRNPQNGVKQDELDWTGFSDWLKEQKGSITKQAALDFLKANEVQVQEVHKGSPYTADRNGLDARIRELSHWPEDAMKAKRPEDQSELDRLNARWEAEEPSPTKFGQHVLPGGDNYRELLLTLPPKHSSLVTWEGPENVDLNLWAGGGGRGIHRQWLSSDGSTITEDPRRGFVVNSELVQNATQPTLAKAMAFYQEQKHEYETKFPNRSKSLGNYTGGHWTEPNVLAHVRMNDRVGPKGERILHVEEIQSDFGQARRKQDMAATKAISDNWESLVTRMKKDGRLMVRCP